MDPSQTLERTLRASNLVAGVPPELVAEVAVYATRRRFARGAAIFRAGEPAGFLGVVAHGLVKLVRTEPDGTPSIVALWGPRQTLGSLAVITHESYRGDAIVVSSEAEVVTIEAAPLIAAAARYPAIAWALARSMAEHGSALHDKIAIVSAGSVEQRLKALLAHLLERFGDEFEDGTARIPLALSRGELAALVGVTVETTIRAMSRWQKLRLIETSADGFRVLDLAWLGRSGTADVASPAA